ncbi:hypothetical protein [Robertkochia solimangrovi]|uniref:hypothetical protein n=1 Tax=Robertkochia solimangrovi TaxID=2213046 RepID=UPI00117BE4C7|nr:hypothetical protein [Robertkochia solimangrovi]TRZ45896.1 hypothetical protein DMZ48_01065 [Robertkochia solimangrovi]
MVTRIFIGILLLTFIVGCSSDDGQNTSKEEDRAELKTLYDSIVKLSLSEQCINANEWAFTARGSKACGGPSGYIAYSLNIDEVKFLRLVNSYTEKEEAYNLKWNIVSDCMLYVEPDGVVCKDGLPVFYHE